MEHSLTIGFGMAPNTNHTGFFVCKSKGIFDDNNVDVTLSWTAPNTEHKPVQALKTKEIDVAIVFPETVIEYNALGREGTLKAIATVFNTNMLAFGYVNREGKKIESPKDLANCTLGTLGRPFEKEILEAMIRADGGQPNIKVKPLPSLDYISFLNKEVGIDVVPLYQHWHSLLARNQGLKLVEFNPVKYGIECVPSPCLAVLNDRLRDAKFMSSIQRLLDSLVQGYEFAAENPKEAAKIAKTFGVEPEAIIEESQMLASGAYVEKGTKRWGFQDPRLWDNYLGFFRSTGILKQLSPGAESLPNHSVFTNEMIGSALKVEEKAVKAGAEWLGKGKLPEAV